MRSVWIITEFCRDVTGYSGKYPWDSGNIVAICGSKDKAMEVVKDHVERQIKDARDEVDEINNVTIYNESPEDYDELVKGITCMRVVETVEPHRVYEYGVAIREWMVIDE